MKTRAWAMMWLWEARCRKALTPVAVVLAAPLHLVSEGNVRTKEEEPKRKERKEEKPGRYRYQMGLLGRSERNII